MFTVFGKIKKVEYEKSFNKFGVKIRDNEEMFSSNSRCYQIAPNFSSEEIAREFIRLCRGKEDVIRPVFIARLEPVINMNGKEKINKKTKKPLMKYTKYKDVEK